MSVDVWSGIIALVAAPVGAWLMSIFLRQKYNVEINTLRAELDKKLSEVKGSELDNVREGMTILMDQIVAPLKAEIKYLRLDVNKFRRAIEKIPSCPMSAECPVSRELLADEKGSQDADSDNG